MTAVSVLLFHWETRQHRDKGRHLAIAFHPEYLGNEESDGKSLQRQPQASLPGQGIRKDATGSRRSQNLILTGGGADEEDSTSEPFAPDWCKFHSFPQRHLREGQRGPSLLSPSGRDPEQ